MKVKTIIKELAFEKDCSEKEASKLYKKYKQSNKVDELVAMLMTHKEVPHEPISNNDGLH